MYMGWLPDGREAVIKCMEDDMDALKAEVTVLHSVSHKHIVRLFGYCVVEENRRENCQLLPECWKKKEQQGKLLVYEFIENRSLDIYLHGQTSPSPVTTSWKMRIEILLGVSRAIEYLQSYAQRPVIHRDIKSSNILVDAGWAPRLTDFGLALTWEGPDHTDSIVGTAGYLDPDYYFTQTVNPTIDVYSFGVVMLEVLTGKKAYFFQEEWEKREACEEEKREVQEDEQKRDEWKRKEEATDECKEEDMTEEWDEGTKEEEGDEPEEEDMTEEPDEETEEMAKQDNFAPGSLVNFAVPPIEASELWKVLDRRPAAEPTPRQLEAAEVVAQAAVRCVSLDWKARPSISEVVATLETALELARCDG